MIKVMTHNEARALRDAWNRKHALHVEGRNFTQAVVAYQQEHGPGARIFTEEEWVAMGARYPGDLGRQREQRNRSREPRPLTVNVLRQYLADSAAASILMAFALDHAGRTGERNPLKAIAAARLRLDAQRREDRAWVRRRLEAGEDPYTRKPYHTVEAIEA